MIKNPIKLSVIIPAYKRRQYVTEAIKSVLNLKGIDAKNLEIVVPDDEDDPKIRTGNRSYFKKLFRNLIYLENQNLEGPGGNRQTGFDVASGKYIVFLDCDDSLKPNFFIEMKKSLDEKKSIAALCFSDSIFDKGFSRTERLKLIPMNLVRDISLFAGYLMNNKYLYPSSFYFCQFSHMLFKNGSIKGLKFNYDYRHGGEDWDFFIKTLKKGEITIVPEKLVKFRFSPGSSTNDPKNRIRKWKSYRLLISRLSDRFKSGIFYQLLLIYIGLFENKHEKT